MLNKVFLQGNLTKDVELRQTQNNKEYVFFTLAVQKDFNKDQVDFIDCRAWGATAKFMAREGKKGRRVLVKDATVTTYMYKEQKNWLIEVRQLDVDFEARPTASEGQAVEPIETPTTVANDDAPF